ncbi:hypothetical protein HU200_045336 [Digitaria exilis]|uniref:C2H2-type domain-containing protein n=1 Tax=Digitaria exilis TaxID=1010633 RepID=A0A835B349_9POAL|nr:hypothetical protein HU200_045336 [Digitaria exilis]
MVVVQGDEYYSDTDSDDDVDRYVFLARHPPPPAARHAEDDDRGASSENHDDDDDDGDATEEDEKEPERGRGVKRTKVNPLREISDDDDVPPPPPKKKARVVELTAPPFVRTQLMSNSGSESDSAPSPFGVRAEGESGSEGSHHEKAHQEHRRDPGNRKRGGGVCGKRRRRGPGCEEGGDRESHVAAAAAAKIVANSGALPATVTSGRFLCPECERCFDNHRALGGHVLGHRKKEKIAIAAAAAATNLYLDDAGGGAGDYREETTAVAKVNGEETANGTAQADMMGVVVAARRGKGIGRHGKIKIVDWIAENRDEDVDDDHVNDGNPGFGNKQGNAKAVSGGRDFTNGSYRSNDKVGIGAAIPSKVVVVGACHEGANGGDGNVSCRTTLYKCKVCGAECTTGRALGGHMRKHRKRPPPPGGEEGRSPSPPTDDDYQMTLARLFGAENKIGLV